MSKEVILDHFKAIVSSTDLQGNIKYCNKYFLEVSGYSEKELLRSSHNIIRHEDMPKVIFKFMWERIEKDKNILVLIKNKTKNGDYYWVSTHFETKYHVYTKERDGYLALKRGAPKHAVEKIAPLYEKLLEIELQEGLEASQDYLVSFLASHNTDYDTYINKIMGSTSLKKFFSELKKVFH